MLNRKLNLGFVLVGGFFATVLTIAGCSGGGSSSGTAGGDPVEVGVLEKAPADINQLPGGHGQSFGNQAIHCSSAKISWPSANTSIDQVDAVQYILLPEGCGLTGDENLKWGAYYSELALGRSAETKGFTAYIGTSRAKANIPCAGGDDSTQMVHYDFRQLGIALGDSALDKYKTSVTHKVKPGDCDGDGTPNNQDGNNGTSPLCTTAKIIWPNDEIAVGNNADIKWDLMPANCAITEAQNKNIKLRAVSGKIQSTSNAKGVAAQVTTIRIPCDPKLGTGPRAVAYDFTELGQALGDTAGGYKHTITHPASSKGCSGDGGGTDPGPGEPNQCPIDATGKYPNCSCPNGTVYNANKNDCEVDDGPGKPNQCPIDATGKYPNCSCPAGQEYDKNKNDCVAQSPQCPADASGTYPNCSCPVGYTYDKDKNDCVKEPEQFGTIEGVYWQDIVENGRFDSDIGHGYKNEALADVRYIYLKKPDGSTEKITGIGAWAVPTYRFKGLSPGTYTVSVDVVWPEWQRAITPTSVTVNLAAGEVKKVDFGMSTPCWTYDTGNQHGYNGLCPHEQ
jgi:hypothetical protein